MRVALLGQFGSGNYGNDGSLAAMIATLRRAAPAAELVCICSGPEAVSARFGIPARTIGASRSETAGAGALGRLVMRLPGRAPGRIMGVLATIRACRGLDAVIVPGTGILDDFHDRAFGWPFVLLRWCVAARLAGARIALVSIGAGPIRGRLSRRFLLAAARLAGFRSYRDEVSRDFMAAAGFDVTQDPVRPDLALGLPPPPPQGASGTVGVGLMSYYGWRKDGPDGEAIFAAYIARMADFVAWLREAGWRVHLLGGDDSDARAVEAVAERVDEDGALRRAGLLTIGAGRSLEVVMAELSRCDLVTASRFHNVLSAVRVGRPTLSIGYAEKNRALLAAAGLGDFCLEIEDFDLPALQALFRRLAAERAARAAGIDGFLAEAARSLAAQEARLLAYLGDQARAGATRPMTAPSPRASRARASGRLRR